MVTFENGSAPIAAEDISDVERALEIKLPAPVRELYLHSNGGEPSPYVYEDETVDTVVSEFLPLISREDVVTAGDVYRHLVSSKKIVGPQYFPFAVCGGGDYFFVDCTTCDGQTYFYVHDSVTPGLRPLKQSFTEFWNHLKPE